MKLKLAASLIGLGFALVAPALPARAESNPSDTGQPGVECGEEGATSNPPGFATDGFANAEERYAGSDGTPSLRSGNEHAVSQYDVACFQFTSSGH
jgi:hypothetical protein